VKDKVHKHWSNFTTPTQRKYEVKNNSGTSSSTLKEFSILDRVCYINTLCITQFQEEIRYMESGQL